MGHSHNLPLQLTPFIGREKEVATVQQQLLRPDVRLVTLTGPGGVGKTRLGLQVAVEASERFADGTWFVSLAPISDPDLVIPTIAQTLDMRETRGWPLLEQLKASLREKQVLLLLDNFEQVISAAVQVADLLATCPQLKVLVTSREALHVRAEHEFPVPVLALPDPRRLPDLAAFSQYEGVALFIERARAVMPDFQVTNANATTIAEICTRLDGLPLAIELAAARIKMFPPQALLTRLDQRLQFLTSSLRDVPARQQTLRKTIQWSYDLLAGEEQRLFQRLSVFAGGCTLQAIESLTSALGNDALRILDEVVSLIDKNLLQQTAQEGEDLRLTMLETVREYGLEALEASREAEATRQAHAAYYLRLAQEAEPELLGPQQALWLKRLELEHDNLRAALGWALEEVTDEEARERREFALHLSAALGPFWVMHGHHSEARIFLERALAGKVGESVALRIRVLQTTANIAVLQSDLDRAEALAQQSLALCRELGDTRGIANSLPLLEEVAWARGRTGEALALTEEEVRLLRQIGEPGEIALALFGLADIVSNQGEYVRGQALFEEALQLFRNAGNELWVGATLVRSAFYLYWSASSDVATVRQRLQQGQALITNVGARNWIAHGYGIEAMIALSERETARAYDLSQKSLAIYREMDDRWYIAVVLNILGRVEAQRSDLRAARSRYVESLALAQELGEKWITPFNLEGLADVLTTQGKLRWAAQLWGAAEVLREGTTNPLPAVDRPGYERAVATARVQLGEQAFSAAWQEGRAMTPEQALAAQGQVIVLTQTSAVSSPISPTKQRAHYPAGLTAREVEVLQLVAQGLTDAQVADRLVISPRTVNTHLTSIYNKLGVDTRTAASRFAVDQRLV